MIAARAVWMQGTLFDEPGVRIVASRRGRPSGPWRRFRRPNSVRVTRDPAVAASWDLSHRASSQVTYLLAQALSDAQISQLRELLKRPRAGQEALSASR